MIKRMAALAAMVTILVVTLVPAHAESPTSGVFKATLSVGREMTYDLTQSIGIEQERKGVENVADDFLHAARLHLKVESELPDSGVHMSATISDLVIIAKAGTRHNKFMGGDNAGTLSLPKVSGDIPSDEGLDALGKAILDAKIEFNVNAQGDISGISGLEGALDALRNQKTYTLGSGDTALPDARLLGPFVPSNLQEVLARLFQIDGAGKQARASGSTWQSTRSVPLPPVGTMEITNDWSVKSVDSGVATINGAMTLEIDAPASADAQTPKVTIDSAEGETTIQWDITSGALSERQTNQKIVSTWALGELSVKQTQSFRMYVRASK